MNIILFVYVMLIQHDRWRQICLFNEKTLEATESIY